MITCGNCKQKHPTPAEVRECYSAAAHDLQPQVLFGKDLPASDRQMDFLKKLTEERGLGHQHREWTRSEASAEIDRLQAMPRVRPSVAVAATEELVAGMYRHPDSGEILKVYKAVHGSGKMCAKRLVVETEATVDFQRSKITVPGTVRFDYLGLATRFVRGHVRMTLADAKEFGAIYGVCCVCGRTLTDEKSIEAGIGPVCAGRI